MKINTLSNTFEQIHTKPPRTAIAMARNIYERYSHHRTVEQDGYSRDAEMAHALLHMRLYQRFGPDSQRFSDQVHQTLDDLFLSSPRSSVLDLLRLERRQHQ